MEIEILEHDLAAGTAKIKFMHKDVTHIQAYNLKLVVPGTEKTLIEYNTEFDAGMQQTVIDKLIAQVEREIDAGILVNAI